VYQPVHLPRE